MLMFGFLTSDRLILTSWHLGRVRAVRYVGLHLRSIASSKSPAAYSFITPTACRAQPQCWAGSPSITGGQKQEQADEYFLASQFPLQSELPYADRSKLTTL